MKKPKEPLYKPGQTVWGVTTGDVFLPADIKVMRFVIERIATPYSYIVRAEGSPGLVTAPECAIFPTEIGAHMWLSDYAGIIADREVAWVKARKEERK